MCDNKYNSEAVENIEQENAKDADNDKTEEEMSESGETTSSTTESDVSDVEMDSNNEDPFAWDKQVWPGASSWYGACVYLVTGHFPPVK